MLFTIVRLVSFSALTVLLLTTLVSSVPFKVTRRGCCKKTSTLQIHTEITDCRMEAARRGCVDAIVFTSRSKHYCCSPKSTWVQTKLQELEQTNMPCKSLRMT